MSSRRHSATSPDSRPHEEHPNLPLGAGPTVLTVPQVAELLGVSRWFVYDHGPELGLVKVGGANRYLRERVEGYLTGQLPASPERAAPAAHCRQRSPLKTGRRVALLDPATSSRPERGAA